MIRDRSPALGIRTLPLIDAFSLESPQVISLLYYRRSIATIYFLSWISKHRGTTAHSLDF